MVRIYEVMIVGEKKLNVPDVLLQDSEEAYLRAHAEEFARKTLKDGWSVVVFYRGNEAVKS